MTGTGPPRRLLVLGGSGYLGRHLARAARAEGWEVVATSFAQPGVRVDVRDADAVSGLVAAHPPAAVVNCAYLQHGPDAWAVNVTGAANAATAARRAGARLVHLSSDVVFDGTAGPYAEDDAPGPVSDYGRSKLDAEHAVAEIDPAAVIVRTSLIYGGPGGEPSTQERLAHEPGAVFFTDELRCPVQVDDLAHALLELVDLPVRGLLHVAGPTGVSRWELAGLITGGPVRGAPSPPGRPLDARIDTTRATALLSTRLRGVDEVYGPGSAAAAGPDR